MKKIAILSLVLAMAFAFSVTPAAAFGFNWGGSDITVSNVNVGTSVISSVEVEAETGDNEVEGKGMIVTGNAGAESYIENVVNTSSTTINACSRCSNTKGDVEVKNFNFGTSVISDVEVEAETGDNEIEGSRRSHRSHSGGLIVTGDAGAFSGIFNVVNSNITRIRR